MATSRLAAIDRMRGLVMVLMTVDHAMGRFSAQHLMTDGAHMYRVGQALPVGPFLTRWITHLCAPTFVFLAGASLALSAERRIAVGESSRAIDRFSFARGALVALLELWMALVFRPRGAILLQVLYALGVGMMAMAALRRVPTRWLVAGAAAFIAGGEALSGVLPETIPTKLLVTGGSGPGFVVPYPALHWLAIMALGWGFGRWLLGRPQAPWRRLAITGAACLALFLVVRGINGYGNAGLSREGGSLVQWLHVSKYPPAISFVALELGIALLLLAAFFRLGDERPLLDATLGLLGQTALFYYLLHAHLLAVAAWATGLRHKTGLGAAHLAAFGALVTLYPACRWYRRYKHAHPAGWARFI